MQTPFSCLINFTYGNIFILLLEIVYFIKWITLRKHLESNILNIGVRITINISRHALLKQILDLVQIIQTSKNILLQYRNAIP